MTCLPIRNRRGFATILAIALLGLVATALVLLTKQLANDSRRTTLAAEDAQLRQLLLAGAQSTVEHAKAWGAAPNAESWKIELPASLAESNATLSVVCSFLGADQVHVEITARLDGREAVQTLQLKRSGKHWVVGEVRWGTAPAS